MARIEKYKSYQVGRIFLHNNRTDSDGVTHSNEQIDNNRTHMNYSYKKGNAEDVGKRVSQVFSVGRSDATVMCEAVITLPKNVPEKDEKKFFQSVYNFFAEEFHEENIVNAVVHKDESRPHMHLDFVPVIRGDFSYRNESHHTSTRLEKWKAEHDGELERLCAKNLITREFLDTLHPRLSAYVEQDLGYEAEIMNGATDNGNKTVLQLKVQTLKTQVEELQKAREYLGDEIAKMYQVSQSYGITPENISFFPLVEMIEQLHQREEIYKSIMKRNGYTYTKSELESLKQTRNFSSGGSQMSVCDGRYSDSPQLDMGKNVLFVVELDESETLNGLPYTSKLFERAETSDIKMTFQRTPRTDSFSGKKVMLNDKGRKNSYCFIKKTPEAQVSSLLQELEHELRAFSKKVRETGEIPEIYMDRLASDKYNAGMRMLEMIDAKINYYSGDGYVEELAEEADKNHELTVKRQTVI